jgi:hypothetical protein
MKEGQESATSTTTTTMAVICVVFLIKSCTHEPQEIIFILELENKIGFKFLL